MDPYRQRWLELLLAERARRTARRAGDPEAMERLLAQLAEMGERLRAAGGFGAPDDRDDAGAVEDWLATRYRLN